jgi:hypothetical protein
VPPGSTSNSFTLTIATPNTTASNSRPLPVTWAFLSFPIAIFVLRSRNSRKAIKLATLALLSLTPLFATGCGDRISTANSLALAAKSYTITVTGTATTSTGSILQRSTTVTLMLEQPQ